MNSKKVTILLVFTILLIFSVVSRIFFNDFQDGWVAYTKKDYKTAYELWLPLAEQGDSKAQFFLGFIHDMGLGYPENDKKALKWYKLTAEQGDSRGQLFTGFMYNFGHGVPKDYQKAVKWYQLASEQGYKQAKINIYKLANKNYPEALKILLNDVEKGSAKAQVYLAKMREVKLVTTQDNQKTWNQDQISEEQEYVQVGKLMLSLVSRNDPEDAKKIILDGYRRMTEAKQTLSTLYAEGQEVRQNQNNKLKWYTAAEYSEKIIKLFNLAKKGVASHALENLISNAEKGVVEAQFILAMMYANGRGVLQDNKEAFKWFYRIAKEKGAALADKEEQLVLNKFKKKNIPQILKFLTNDAENGIADAQFKLGIAYALGHVVKQDSAQAVKWYRLAAEQGNSKAQYNLGVMYVKGLGVLANKEQAMKWFQLYLGRKITKLEQTTVERQDNIYSLAKRNVEAALKILVKDAINGKATAAYYLGDLYRDEIGVSRNLIYAYMWYNISVSQGKDSAVDQIILLEKKMTRQEIQEAQVYIKDKLQEYKSLGAKEIDPI
jgi:TPR repeat protein